MRPLLVILALVAIALVPTVALAQCNAGGSGGCNVSSLNSTPNLALNQQIANQLAFNAQSGASSAASAGGSSASAATNSAPSFAAPSFSSSAFLIPAQPQVFAVQSQPQVFVQPQPQVFAVQQQPQVFAVQSQPQVLLAAAPVCSTGNCASSRGRLFGGRSVSRSVAVSRTR